MIASPSRLNAIVAMRRTSFIRPTPPMAGVGRIAFAIGLVVERAIAGDDGEVERAAGLADAVDAGDDLAHDLGLLRIAEIEIVGDGERQRADGA